MQKMNSVQLNRINSNVSDLQKMIRTQLNRSGSFKRRLINSISKRNSTKAKTTSAH